MLYTLLQITQVLESWAPLSYQETYDNSGLLFGDTSMLVTKALLTLDVTPAVVNEAIAKGCNLIIAHHPVIFNGIKKFTLNTPEEEALLLAIQNNIALYAAHTNVDNVSHGVNEVICNKLNLHSCQILAKRANTLSKLVVYVPVEHVGKVQTSLFNAGAGSLGAYSNCSFRTNGIGTFTPSLQAKPFIGIANEFTEEPETRLEVLIENTKLNRAVKEMIVAHPYEEVAYEILPVQNKMEIGSGKIGFLKAPMKAADFISHVKTSMEIDFLKYVPYNKDIQKVAVCGGSGSFLLKHAIAQGADAFISSDFKYHEYFGAIDKLMVCDIGHYETEKFTPELFAAVLSDKLPNFATLLSGVNTNPIKYG